MSSPKRVWPALLLALTAPAVAGAADRPELSSDKPLEFDQETKSLVARGNAKLTSPQFQVDADEIAFNQEKNQAIATGQVRLSHKALRVVTRSARYDMVARTIATGAIRMGRPPLFVEAESLEGGAQEMKLTNATVYFNEPDPYGFSLQADTLTYYGPEDRLVGTGAIFRLGSVPIFYLPSYSQRGTEKLPIGIKSRLGFSNFLGGYDQNAIYYIGRDDFQPGGLLDYYSKHGVLAGPAMRYNFGQPDYGTHGAFLSGYIHDYGKNRGTDILGRPIPMDRYFIDWGHKQSIGERVDLTGTMYWWRDSSVVRDFRPDLYRDNQFPDNYVEGVYRGSNYYVSAFTRYRPNNFQVVQERLPEVRFDMVPTPIAETGIYQQSFASYALLRENPIDTGQKYHSSRVDGYYGISRPFTPTNYYTFTPVTGVRGTSYLTPVDRSAAYTRVLPQIGFDSALHSYGQWGYKNEFWEVDGLRHVLRPVAQYRFVPSAEQGQAHIAPIDSEQFTTYPEPIDISNTRNVDNLYTTNTLRVGTENILQTRDKDWGSRDLAYLNVYEDFRFSRRPTSNQFSDLYASTGVMPAYWLGFDLYNRFDPQDATLREIRTRTRVMDGEEWSFSVVSSNLQHRIDQYYFEGAYKINERYSVNGRWRFDHRIGKVTEQIYALRTLVGNSWDIEWQVIYRQEADRDNGLGFNVQADLVTF